MGPDALVLPRIRVRMRFPKKVDSALTIGEDQRKKKGRRKIIASFLDTPNLTTTLPLSPGIRASPAPTCPSEYICSYRITIGSQLG